MIDSLHFCIQLCRLAKGARGDRLESKRYFALNLDDSFVEVTEVDLVKNCYKLTT